MRNQEHIWVLQAEEALGTQSPAPMHTSYAPDERGRSQRELISYNAIKCCHAGA